MFWDSDEETSVTAKGNVNNNVVLSAPVELHDNVYYLIVALIFIQLAQLLTAWYATFRRSMKKRYAPNASQL